MASINATNTNTSLVKEYRTLFDWRKKRCILQADVEASCTVLLPFSLSSLVQQASMEASSGDRGFTVLRKFSWELQGHKGLNRIWSESPSILGHSFSFMQMNQCPKSAKTRWNANDKDVGCEFNHFVLCYLLLSSTAKNPLSTKQLLPHCVHRLPTPQKNKKKQENKNQSCPKGTVPLAADCFQAEVFWRWCFSFKTHNDDYGGMVGNPPENSDARRLWIWSLAPPDLDSSSLERSKETTSKRQLTIDTWNYEILVGNPSFFLGPCSFSRV